MTCNLFCCTQDVTVYNISNFLNLYALSKINQGYFEDTNHQTFSILFIEILCLSKINRCAFCLDCDGVMETEFLIAPSSANGVDNGVSNSDNGQDALHSVSLNVIDGDVDDMDIGIISCHCKKY